MLILYSTLEDATDLKGKLTMSAAYNELSSSLYL